MKKRTPPTKRTTNVAITTISIKVIVVIINFLIS